VVWAQPPSLLIMEAMKIEHTICAPLDGEVRKFHFQVGDKVSGGDELLEFAPAGND
jgi:3-methylcrotonyl-CoA carboxylase alpha subunit